MWRWTSKALVIAAMSCWLVGTAQAGPITFSPDIFNPTDVLFTGLGSSNCVGNNSSADTVSGQNLFGCKSLTYTHALSGYQPSTDTLTAASLGLTFYDNYTGVPDTWVSETFDLKIDNQQFNNIQIVNSSTQGNPSTFSYGVLASLSADNLLSITLSLGNDFPLSLTNNFYFASSTLTASGTQTVPEPSASLLLGLGFLGIAGYQRWHKKQSQTV